MDLGRPDRRLLWGRITMVAFALLGNLPVFFGASILKATTISGALVLGLAPVFLFPAARRLPAAVFLDPVGVSIAGGILSTVWPQILPWKIGSGAPRSRRLYMGSSSREKRQSLPVRAPWKPDPRPVPFLYAQRAIAVTPIESGAGARIAHPG
ncbi:MAG TPA: hypothetical protein VFJ58_05345 [Armatimonadota bacterium]|nr:hypothetical protein [Armatimonadota bacterium]